MGVVSFFSDRLTNIMSGKGTTADRRMWDRYSFVAIDPVEAESAYRSSWLVRKIVDVPALDMTRAWRDWQSDKETIQALEAAEKRLQLKEKCKRALILSRLYGGGALLLGTNDADPSQPLDLNRIGKDGLTYVHVFSRWQLSLGPQRLDPVDPFFGKPEYYQLNVNPVQQQLRIHPSRVVEFIGQRNVEGSWLSANTPGSWFWGDPIMQSVGQAVRNADLAQDGFAALIDEAKIDILSIPGLVERASTPEYEQQLLNRLQAASQGKSNWRALMIDGNEKWEQKQVTWAGIPAMMEAFLLVVAGAADIPMTRLLGQSPKGLQSTGDSEERDYQSMISARQHEQLVPALDRVDELLIRSMLGTRPTDIYYTMGPLQEASEKDAALMEYQAAQTIAEYAATGLIQDEALSAIAKNRIIESGRWPGSEAAFEEFANEPLPNELPANEPTPTSTDPHQLTTLEQRIAAMEGKGKITKDQAYELLTDSTPRSLYVSRKLLNAPALTKWAKGQGFETTVAPDEMHVTVLYSREPVDWMAMGSDSWGGDDKGQLRVAPGGPRMLDRFGSMSDAVVLLFSSSQLSWRHQDMIGNGASSDYPDYAPHITLSYSVPADFDLSAVEPYQGELVFGPEVFAEVNDDWKSTIEEE
jgi:phage-related protein (TIGR01555 family)